jgi:hypothetical protein
MEDKSMPAQAAAEAQETQYEQKHYSGGNALLDAEVAAEEQVESNPVNEKLKATNMAGNTDTDDPTDAKNFTTTGDYPADQKRLDKDYS